MWREDWGCSASTQPHIRPCVVCVCVESAATVLVPFRWGVLCFVCFDWISDFRIALLNKCLYFRVCDHSTHGFANNRIFHSVPSQRKAILSRTKHKHMHVSTTTLVTIDIMWMCREPTSCMCRVSVCVSALGTRSHQCTLVRFQRILNWIILKLSSCVNLMMDEDKAAAAAATPSTTTTTTTADSISDCLWLSFCYRHVVVVVVDNVVAVVDGGMKWMSSHLTLQHCDVLYWFFWICGAWIFLSFFSSSSCDELDVAQ